LLLFLPPLVREQAGAQAIDLLTLRLLISEELAKESRTLVEGATRIVRERAGDGSGMVAAVESGRTKSMKEQKSEVGKR
jgi:hypothetical protein